MNLAAPLRDAFWPLPALGLGSGVALGVGLPLLEQRVAGAGGLVGFGGDPTAARGLLAAVATMTVSIIGLAFSVTLVALTLASQQLSPRVLRTFRADRLNQATLAAFLGVAVFALLILRSVREGEATRFVPGLSVSLAIAATVAALGLFVAFVDNIVRSLQPGTIIQRIAADGKQALARAAARGGERPAGEPAAGAMLRAERAGYVQDVDAAAVVECLAGAGGCARVLASPGDFVVTGDPLLALDAPDRLDEDLTGRLRGAIRLGRERTLEQDVAFPVRQLADIALKARSPSLNDSTTAENALGSLGELLVEAAAGRVGPRALRDGDGQVRLVTAEPDLDDLVRLGFDQVRLDASHDAVIAVRMLELLAAVRRAAVHAGGGCTEAERQARLLVEAFEGAARTADDARRVRERWAALFERAGS